MQIHLHLTEDGVFFAKTINQPISIEYSFIEILIVDYSDGFCPY